MPSNGNNGRKTSTNLQGGSYIPKTSSASPPEEVFPGKLLQELSVVPDSPHIAPTNVQLSPQNGEPMVSTIMTPVFLTHILRAVLTDILPPS